MLDHSRIDHRAATAPLLALVREHFADAADLHPFASGEFSRAFAFTAHGRDYVLRVNDTAIALEAYVKDDYAWRHFASPDLPIPRVNAIGPYGNGHYAISERVPGRVLTECSPEERRALLPSLLDTLDAIGRVDVSHSHGYGDWVADGNGRYASWRAFLARVIENDDEGYYQDWHALFSESFLERELYELIYRRMMRLLARCPDERSLIHNDYWFMNLIGEGDRITGVIDWANALYGDHLYEIARLAWGADFPDWWYADGAAILQARYGAILGYAERLACYQCHIALDDLRFYAKTGRREEYTWARDRLLALVAADPEPS